MRHIVLSCPNVIQDSTDTSKNIRKAKLFSLFVTGNEKCPDSGGGSLGWESISRRVGANSS